MQARDRLDEPRRGQSHLRKPTGGAFLLRLGAFVLLTASCGDVLTPATTVTLHRRQSIEEWHSAQALADAYVPEVRAGNSAVLGSARVPFAIYIVTMHRLLHNVLEEELRVAREAYPELRGSDDMTVDIELVLNQEDGRLARLGVFKSSGSVVFDTVALDAFRNAAPFGAPPRSIVSPCGNVYVHWTLHTDPTEACDPHNARPFLLANLPPPRSCSNAR